MLSGGIKYQEVDRFRKKLGAQHRKADAESAMRDSLELIVSIAKMKYLTGGNPLNVQTGRLRASVKRSEPAWNGAMLRGSVGTDVFYGRVHEFGAQTPGHAVRPVRARVLAWRGAPYGAHGQGTGLWHFAKKVVMKPKPWLGPSIDDAGPRILAIFRAMNVPLK